MAVDMFLELDGIDGESADKTHSGKIEIMAFSWTGSNSGTMHVSTGGGAGKAQFGDLSVTKYVDKATPVLWKKLSDGAHIAKGKLIVRKAGGDPLEYLKLEMDHILVSNIAEGGTGGDDRLIESVSLNFRAFKVIYTPQSKEGTPEGEVEHGWNIAENASK